MSFPIRIDSRFPPLALDYINSGPIRRLFNYSPTSKGLEQRLDALRNIEFDRPLISDTLMTCNRRSGCSESTLRNIESLADADTVIVSCGHQACLGGGPLYVAYKILTAIKTAEYIRTQFNRPTVPLFWLATDDDDISEVKSLQPPQGPEIIFDPCGFNGMAGYLPNPSEEIHSLPSLPGSNWDEYHQKLLHRYFGRFGLIVLSAISPETHQIRRTFFEAFKSHRASMHQAITRQSEIIAELGFKPQVKPRKEDSFLFQINGQSRKRLLSSPDTISTPLSTTALSRLLSLEYSLPIVAEISGPSEIAYHAQTKLMYETLGRTQPVILPRFSATLIRESDQQTVQTAGITVQEVLLSRSQAEQRAADQQIPPAAQEALEQLKEGLTTLFQETRDSLATVDSSLTGSAEAAYRKAQTIHSYLAKKTLNALRRRALEKNPALCETIHFLFPDSLQERKYNFIFLIPSDGSVTELNTLLDYIEPLDFSHCVITLPQKA